MKKTIKTKYGKTTFYVREHPKRTTLEALKEPEYVCKCPKCGCEIEIVRVRRGYIKKFKTPTKYGRKYGRVSGVHKYRVKVKESTHGQKTPTA